LTAEPRERFLSSEAVRCAKRLQVVVAEAERELDPLARGEPKQLLLVLGPKLICN
jgi:hypothetical protein